MGISGLLPLLKSIHKPATLKKFAGQTIGIDAYGWLHRGTVACAIELATGKPTTKYVDFAMSRVRMLLDFGVTPYLVFDGDAIPSKAGTNAERRRRREESLTAGLELYRAGKVSQAHQELQKAAGVTPLMARELIDELKRNNIQYVVAPFEADAQLAYLEKKGIINGVLSEDSDLLVFGVKRLLTKLNQYGECIEIERADFANCTELSLVGWTDTMFRRMAILSGCDYLINIPKMGLKTAYRYVRKYKDGERLLRMVALEGFLVPAGYVESFNNAELTFMHHRVFCPIEKRLVFLNELAPGTREEEMPFLGSNVESDVAIGVACGDLNPKTKEPLRIRSAAHTTHRPPLKDLRHHTMPVPSALKPSKSIDTFFKPHRQPLAELDPNSLTPSPSQQRLYQVHRNASWEPRLVSSAPQLRRAETANTQTPSIATDRRAFLAKAGQISMYQPPKRQRLCSESGISPSKEVKQSPFFANSSLDEPSPLARKKNTKKKTKKGGFDIFADDSISDEAFLEAANIQQAASPEETVQYPIVSGREEASDRVSPQEDGSPRAIVQSSPIKPTADNSSTSNSRRSFDTVITNIALREDLQDGTTSPVDRDGVEQFEDILEWHIRKQNKKLRQSFVCQSPETRQSALASVTSPKLPAPSPRNALEASTFLMQSPEKQASALRSLSPLVGGREVEEAVSPAPAVATVLQGFTYQTTPTQTIEKELSTRRQTKEDKVAAAKASLLSAVLPAAKAPTSSLQRIHKAAVAPRKIPDSVIPPAHHDVDTREFGNIITTDEDYTQVQEIWVSKGSEDLLVPDSEEEENVDAPEELERNRKFDMTAFAFTGR